MLGNIVQPEDLVRAHIDIQLGTFFSSLQQIAPNLFFVSSEHISDFYWNYAFALNGTAEQLPTYAGAIREHAGLLKRSPVLFLTPAVGAAALSAGLGVRGRCPEAWLILNRARFHEGQSPGALKIVQVAGSKDLQDFLKAYRDAYGPAESGAAGYGFTPESYPQRIWQASPADRVKVMHFLGRVEQEPVCLSSIYCQPPFAGLYNVGTIHSARRRHYATAMSQVAIGQALACGCEIIFLQTQPESLLERLYQAIGFERRFLGEFLLLTEKAVAAAA